MPLEAAYPHEVKLTFTQTLALVSGVLLVHLWLLGSSAVWFSPQETSLVKAPTLITRQIEAPRAQRVEPVAGTPPSAKTAHQGPDTTIA
ncbi:hypothetical protein, partial [Limnohabitans sp.]|uniref:hypothetical protein n=1 Tax=Limnohabitans sp. TaxID=1907725 RepID=UPI0038B7AEC3